MNGATRLSLRVLLLVGIFPFVGIQAGWSSSSFTIPIGGVLGACDVASFPTGSPEGMVILPNGNVLVALYQDGIYTFSMPTSLQNCPSSPPPGLKLSSYHVRGMTMALDGRIYANDNAGRVVQVDPNNGIATPVPGLPILGGLGMTLDPYTGNIDITVNSGIPKVVEISGLPNNAKAANLVVLNANGVTASVADGLAWSCDGKDLLVADYQADKVWRWERATNTVAFLQFPARTGPDGVAFGAPGTPLARYAYTNTNDGHVYQFSITGSPNPVVVALNGGDGDFVTVDGQGNLLASQSALVTALYWKQGRGTGGFVLPGGTLCQSLHCTTVAASANNPDCLSGPNATTVTALADAACSTSSCGGCASVNLDLTALLTLLNDLNREGCLSPAILGAESLQKRCPCNPDFLACPLPCDPAMGCGNSSLTRKSQPHPVFDIKSHDALLKDW